MSCDSATSAISCEGGFAMAVPCRGTGGCLSDGSKSLCDMRAASGDGCPSSANGRAQCDVANANQAFTCTSRVWKTLACRACGVTGGTVVCAPAPGQPCSAANEGRAVCDSLNADQRLKCTGGIFVAEACKGCAAVSGSITCKP